MKIKIKVEASKRELTTKAKISDVTNSMYLEENPAVVAQLEVEEIKAAEKLSVKADLSQYSQSRDLVVPRAPCTTARMAFTSSKIRISRRNKGKLLNQWSMEILI